MKEYLVSVIMYGTAVVKTDSEHEPDFNQIGPNDVDVDEIEIDHVDVLEV